jgi:MFS family permease
MNARETNRPLLDNTIVNIALPSIQRSLHTTPETLQWTIDAHVLTFAVLILLGGTLGDRFGRNRRDIASMFEVPEHVTTDPVGSSA